MSFFKIHQIILLFLLLAVTFAVFSPMLSAKYANIDDHAMLKANNNKALKDISFKNIIETFKSSHEGLYHPIVTISYSIEKTVFGFVPEIFHFDNIILHLINTILVFIIFFILSKSFWVSFLTMTLFGIHPVHVEVVAWLSARKDLLYSLFYLLSILFYLKSYESKKTLFLIISFFCFLLSCMSKPMAVTLPLILILLDYFDNKLEFNKQFLIKYLPYMLTSLAFMILGIFIHYDNDITKTFALYKLFKNILSTHFHYLFYLYKFVLPINLYCSYPYFYPLKEFPPIYITLSPIAVYTGIYFLFKSLKYSKKIFFGFSFFIIALLPSSGILPTGIVKVADRYCYLPYIGLFYLTAILIIYLYKKCNSYLKILLICCCLTIFSTLVYLSYERTLDWLNNDTEPPLKQQIYYQESIYFV